jgi:hypothetical protein
MRNTEDETRAQKCVSMGSFTYLFSAILFTLFASVFICCKITNTFRISVSKDIIFFCNFLDIHNCVLARCVDYNLIFICIILPVVYHDPFCEDRGWGGWGGWGGELNFIEGKG